MAKFINWIKETFEEKDGRTSSRRMTAFWLVALMTATVATIIYLSHLIVISAIPNDKVMDVLWLLLWLVITLLTGMLLMYRIINLDQASSFARAVRGDEEPEKIIVKTETINEIIPASKDEKATITNTTTNTTTSSDIG
jgi:hypothetical protein